MSKRAEEVALKAYPVHEGASPQWIKHHLSGGDCAVFIQGYEQAERDLALTIADIYRIHIFLFAVKNNKQGAFTFQILKDEQYQEVLDRFNKAKDYDTEQNTD